MQVHEAEASPGAALLAAVQAGDPLTVQHLLEAGAPPNWRCGDSGASCLLLAAECASCGSAPHADVARMLLEAGAAPDLPDAEGRTPLMAAAAGRDAEASAAMVQLLHDAGSSLDQGDRHGWPALAHALSRGNAAAADALLARGACASLPPGWRDEQGEGLRLALAWAAKQGRLRVVSAFVESGADLAPPAAARAFQPLVWAAAAGQEACVAGARRRPGGA